MTANTPSTFMGALNPNSKSTLPSSLIQTSTSNTMAAVDQQPINYIEDSSSIAIFSAVGHVGLHLVLRPIIRYGLRSLFFKAKEFHLKTELDSKSQQNSKTLKSETEIANDLNVKDNDSSTKPKLKSKKRKKSQTLANNFTGICGAYGEVLTTFSTLSAITYIVQPTRILLYFGLSYPSMPFILRLFTTLNDRKSKLTVGRVLRLSGKSLIVTVGFGFSMAFTSNYLQSIPYFNIFCLSFWDSFTDFLISDGPSK